MTPSHTAMEVLANVDATMLAVDEAANVRRFSEAEILATHRQLVERAPHGHIAGRLRTGQSWIGGNDYNPCGADFVPPPAEEIGDAGSADAAPAALGGIVRVDGRGLSGADALSNHQDAAGARAGGRSDNA